MERFQMRVRIKGGPIEVELEANTGTIDALTKKARAEFDSILDQFGEIGMAMLVPHPEEPKPAGYS
jgi:hypothetical protein